MCPPMPSEAAFASTTIAIAFQRTTLLMRRSIAPSPGVVRLPARRDGVHVRRLRGDGELRAEPLRLELEVAQQRRDAVGAAGLEDIAQRLQPVARLQLLEVAPGSGAAGAAEGGAAPFAAPSTGGGCSTGGVSSTGGACSTGVAACPSGARASAARCSLVAIAASVPRGVGLAPSAACLATRAALAGGPFH